MKILMFWLLSFAIASNVEALDNGLALTPPMGWMTWQRYRCLTNCEAYPNDCVSDGLIRRIADKMVSGGYLEAGYEYLVIDDCWLEWVRDKEGKLQADKMRFPYGMKNLSDYVHSKGLKFGMYEDIGTRTCAGFPGIKGHLEVDANTFAEWAIDYIKIDGCNADVNDYEKDYTDFGMYLNKTGRPIVYSCSWPVYIESQALYPNYTYMAEICNLWRNYADVQDQYISVRGIADWFANNQDRIVDSAGPGHWNDPDMLLIGNYGLSYDQSRSQMAIWAIIAAPLLMSVDLDTIDPISKDILLNKEAIAINQDLLGLQGRHYMKRYDIDVWIKKITPIINNEYSYAIAFQSRRESTSGYPFAFNIVVSELGLTNINGYFVTDVFDPSNFNRIVNIDEELLVHVNPSGVVFLKFVVQGTM